MKNSNRNASLSRMAGAAALVSVTAAAAFAAAGAILWAEPTLDGGGVDDLAATAKIGFVLTRTDQLEARDLATGDDLWHLEPAFGTGGPIDVAAAKKMVVVAGEYGDAEDGLYSHVITYDAATGDELWSNSYGIGQGTENYLIDVATDGKVVVASGVIETADNWMLIVVGMNAKSGNILWSHTGVEGTYAYDLSLEGKVVAVTGQDGDSQGIVLMLDAKTGDILLNTTFQHVDVDESSLDHVAAGKKGALFGGSARIDGVGYALTAYYSFDGLVWTSIAGPEVGEAEIVDVAIVGKTAVTAGYRLDTSGEDDSFGVITGHDVTDGTAMWSFPRNVAGDNDEVDSIAARGNLLVGCGVVPVDPDDIFSDDASDVFGIDVKTGQTWSVGPVPGEVDGGCSDILFAGKSVLWASDGDTPLLVSVATK